MCQVIFHGVLLYLIVNYHKLIQGLTSAYLHRIPSYCVFSDFSILNSYIRESWSHFPKTTFSTTEKFVYLDVYVRTTYFKDSQDEILKIKPV